MTATNHIITGALIATRIHNPAIALVVAVLSHFALDALPHFGKVVHNSKEFLVILGTDIVVASTFLGYLAASRPSNWLLMAACGIFAAMPDLMWLPRFWKELHGKDVSSKKVDVITRFHSKIQWCERPWGIGVELLWFVSYVFALSPFI